MNIERYHILDELTSGRDVRAWKATDTDTGELVHIKELYLEHVDSWKAVELFGREVEALEQLNHVRIPKLVDSWNETGDGTACFGVARAWVEGEPLSTGLKDIEALGEDEVRQILAEVASILEYLHNFRPPVVHRDLTPNHIIRGEDGHLHLVGFGGVQAALPKTQGGSTFVGTSGYVAPEQLMGKAQPASDIYALGATCIALLTGMPASDLPSANMRIQFEEHVDASHALVALLRAMTSPMADRRPADGARLRRRLANLDQALTPYAAKLLDDPAPDALKIELAGDRLLVWPHVSLRRSGLVQFAGIASIGLLILGVVLGTLSMGPYGVIYGGVLGFMAGMAYVAIMLPTLFIPYRLEVDERKIKGRFWLRSVPLEEIDEIEVREGVPYPLVIWANSTARFVKLPMGVNEADWVADRIRERMRKPDA